MVNHKYIDHLIARRAKLTARVDFFEKPKLIALCDAIDRELTLCCPPGERNDIDLLLGRTCAQLPDKP